MTKHDPHDPHDASLPDPLWDPHVADAELQALERALSPLRWPALPFDPARTPAPEPCPRRVWPWLAAALLLVGLLASWLLAGGAPAALRAGDAPRKFVAAAAPLTIPLGELAELTLRPGSLLEFVHWRSDQALFVLHRGGLQARVVPPPAVAPGFFVVDTPLGRVVDMGCRYTLDVGADGREYVVVTEGAVTFGRGLRTVFVPVGAAATIGPAGPSTPCFVDADPELKKAIRAFDLLREQGADFDARANALKALLVAARAPRDSLVLWHLLGDPEPEFRVIAEHQLRDLVGAPYGAKDERTAYEPEEWLPFLRLSAWRQAGK